MAGNDTPVLQSSQKMFSILEYLVEADGDGITDIAEATSIPKSTVHLHLQSLLDIGYVIRDGSEYRPSLKMFELGEQTRENVDVYRSGHQEVDALARETGELVNLGVLENGKIRLVYLEETDQTRQTDGDAPSVSTEFEATRPRVSVVNEDYDHTPGAALDMHATAMGKAILAKLSDADVERIVDRHGLPKHTENTITSREQLFEELERIRARGYAVDAEGRVEQLCCVAASISHDDDPLAAVSVSGLADRWNGEYREQLANEVMNTASMIEIKLAHS